MLQFVFTPGMLPAQSGDEDVEVNNLTGQNQNRTSDTNQF